VASPKASFRRKAGHYKIGSSTPVSSLAHPLTRSFPGHTARADQNLARETPDRWPNAARDTAWRTGAGARAATDVNGLTVTHQPRHHGEERADGWGLVVV
jgi:hypothetical protein